MFLRYKGIRECIIRKKCDRLKSLLNQHKSYSINGICLSFYYFFLNKYLLKVIDKQTLSARTKSMYPSSFISNSSSLETKHSSCSSIHTKTLSVLRLNEIYCKYSSIIFFRWCHAFKTVSSLLFNIEETSATRERSLLISVRENKEDSSYFWFSVRAVLSRHQVWLDWQHCEAHIYGINLIFDVPLYMPAEETS